MALSYKHEEIFAQVAKLSTEERKVFMEFLGNEGIDVLQEFILPQDRQAGRYPLSYAQERLWFLDQMVHGSSLFNMPLVVNLKGKLDVKALEDSLNEIVRRHDNLRATFENLAGNPVQVIAPSLTFTLSTVDLQNFPAADREAEIERLNRETSLAPFDLAEGPLLRWRLARLSDVEHVLFFAIHHIVFDGWSNEIFLKEFALLYDAFVSGKPSPLADLPVQYIDFACWQRQWLQGDVLEAQLSYWRQQLSGELPVLQLPTDRPRPTVQTFRGTIKQIVLPGRLSRPLRRFSQETVCTVFMILLAVFQTMLHKYSHQTDIIVGTGLAGRNRREIEELIGLFVNNLFLRLDLSGNPTVRELLKRVKQITLEAYEHQEIPFQVVVDKLKLERDTQSLSQPVTQVMISYQNLPPKKKSFTLPALVLEPIPQVTVTSKYDLTLSLNDYERNLGGFIEYSTELFDSSAIDRLWGHFKALLESMMTNPRRRLAELTLLTDEERRHLLELYNGPVEEDEFDEKSVIHRFEDQVERTPHQEALADETRQLSYTQLNVRANRLARFLIRRGVGRGSIVAVMEERNIEMIISILGILKAGGTYLPLDVKIPEQRLYSILDDSRTAVLLTREHLIKRIPFITLKRLQNVRSDITFTEARPKIMAVDSLPFPDRSLVDYDRYGRYLSSGCVKRGISLLSSRGCPYQCVYCHHIMSKTFVQRSAQNIFDEVRYHYDRGYNSFVFVDDVFNLDRKNSRDFFERVIQNNLKLRILFPNGLRGDLLTPDYVDLMSEAGVIEFSVALESASPRIQKLIRKNLNIDKLRDILQYTADHHSHIILDLSTMIGFPTETEAEALMTFDFLKAVHWLHFPAFNTVKIYPNTLMATIALENGATDEQIREGADKAYHELPSFLPFSHSFAHSLQTKYLNEYFLLPERLKAVIKAQKQVLTREEILDKYQDYLPGDVNNYPEIMRLIGEPDSPGSDDDARPLTLPESTLPPLSSPEDKLRVLMLDLSQHFSSEKEAIFDVVEAPLGLMYLLTYLQRDPGLGNRIYGKICKSRIDFDSFEELKAVVQQMRPHMICIRTLTFFREFFHKTVSLLKQWAADVPIITGGPYASSDYDTVLADLNVALCVAGEGETTLRELVEKFLENNGKLPGDDELSQIQGIAFIPWDRRERLKQGKTVDIVLLDKTEDQVALNAGGNLAGTTDPSDAAYVLYTSGSTGKPKGVMVGHRETVNLVKGLHRRIYSPFPSPLRVALIAAYTFDASVQQIFAALLLGHTLHIVPDDVKRYKSRLMDYFQTRSIEISDGTPALIKLLVHSDSDKKMPLELKYFIVGGEALPVDLMRDFYECYGTSVQVGNIYGPTECCVDSTLYPVQEDCLEQLFSMPIGKPLVNIRVYILDPYRKPVPIGVPGDIYISGKGVGSGYVNQVETTAAAFFKDVFVPRKRMYRTGDIGRWLANGNIEFLGRNDFQVKIRGFRIELGEIESLLRSHPQVKDCLVLARPALQASLVPAGKDEKRLLAYVIPRPQSRETVEEEIHAGASAEQITDWEKVFDSIYSQSAASRDPSLNIIGWNSSYTGHPIETEEMVEWLDNTVSRILSFKPQRVVELGCGTGLLLFRIAPHCRRYIGTDFSDKALGYVESQLAGLTSSLSQVKLLERHADDLTGIESGSFDMVILNSVVQYFPGFDYFMKVIREAVRVVEPGGIVFIGDVRSLSLLEAFCTSVELFHQDDSLPKEQLYYRVKKRVQKERELMIDPDFFFSLKRHIPRLSHVEVLYKRGKYLNEMNRFRYDVILHVESPDGDTPEVKWRDWQEEGLTLEEISRMLSTNGPELLGIANVPNARVMKDVRTARWLNSHNNPVSYGDFRKKMLQEGDGEIDPEAFWELEKNLPYRVKVMCPSSHSPGCYHVAFVKNEMSDGAVPPAVSPPPGSETDSKALSSYMNNPLEATGHQKLMPELRRFLKNKLPAYMIPSELLLLDSFPLNASGKIDLKRLPDSQDNRPELESAYIAPQTKTEQIIAEAIKEIVKLDRVGIGDNFFELGFDSLLIVQLHAKIKTFFDNELSLVDMFQYPTIRELTKHLNADENRASPLDKGQDRAARRRTYRNRRRKLDRRLN